MDSDKGWAVGEVNMITIPVITITATVTKEMERSFTQEELAEAGGIEGAKTAVVMEAARYGTIVEHTAEAKIVA